MKQSGFTLVEVLVALVVVGLALLALMTNSAHYTRQSSDLRDRTIATWVASNRLAEYRLRQSFPEPGTERGEVVQDGQRWFWLAVVTAAPGEEDLGRIDVAVAHERDPEASIVVLTGFIGRYRAGPGIQVQP